MILPAPKHAGLYQQECDTNARLVVLTRPFQKRLYRVILSNTTIVKLLQVCDRELVFFSLLFLMMTCLGSVDIHVVIYAIYEVARSDIVSHSVIHGPRSQICWNVRPNNDFSPQGRAHPFPRGGNHFQSSRIGNQFSPLSFISLCNFHPHHYPLRAIKPMIHRPQRPPLIGAISFI